jgi:hypothetical protein
MGVEGLVEPQPTRRAARKIADAERRRGVIRKGL